ncbi:hypothetical protein LPJ66_006930 [Kickxella alabastrina]|uniref:Uncharacterized protein n=1 Tax=Kickxella alabastrina TaxID=61397 RepID=A0ACC1ICS1_9FUNG|nr:hypothetical protein LPJ66_006930 [Kickxella alabastrina]
MDSSNLFGPLDSSPETLARQNKAAGIFSAMANTNPNIAMFKLTASAGNTIEQPLRPNERFSGVLVVELSRPISASQIVVELVGRERVLPNLKVVTKTAKSQLFSSSLVVWKAVRKGAVASTVLSDGLHVFNFSCQMPYLNYPQNINRPEFDISYTLESKIFAPSDAGGYSGAGGIAPKEQVVAAIERDMFFTPIVSLLPTPDPMVVVETLCIEKKGKSGKPAIELRAVISGHQVVPGKKMKIDVSIKELSSVNWTKIIARLYERTRCRDSVDVPFWQPTWSSDRELASGEIIRSSVYNFFINDELMAAGKPSTDEKSAASESLSTETMIFPIPLTPCGYVSSEHLEFSHFLRIEVKIPNWLSSERSVQIDIPVQIMTHSLLGATRVMNRQASLNNLEQAYQDNDSISTFSGRSNTGTRPESRQSSERTSMSLDSCAVIVNSLPPRYYDVLPAQRAAPILQLLNQVNASTPSQDSQSNAEQASGRRPSRQSQSTRHTTMSSSHSVETRTIASSLNAGDDANDDSARPMGQIPSLPVLPPPLPLAPMPTSIVADEISNTVIMSASGNMVSLGGAKPRPPMMSLSVTSDSSVISDMTTLKLSATTTPVTADGGIPMSASKQRQNSTPSISHPPQSPMTAYASDPILDASSDEDAGYFKSSMLNKGLDREKSTDRGLFRMRKNSTIKQSR